MSEPISYGGVALVWLTVTERIRNIFGENYNVWSVKTEFEFWRRIKLLTDLVLKENGISLDQLNTAQVGPKARRYLRKIDKWLARQDPRLISG